MLYWYDRRRLRAATRLRGGGCGASSHRGAVEKSDPPPMPPQRNDQGPASTTAKVPVTLSGSGAQSDVEVQEQEATGDAAAAQPAEATMPLRSPPKQPEAERQEQQAENTSVALANKLQLSREASSTVVRPGQIERMTESFQGISTLSGAEMLHRLDIHLLYELELGSIALIDADRIREWDAATPLPMRQECDASMHLPPKTARELLAKGSRQIGVLSYAWRGSRHPDRSGDTLRALQRFLTQDPRGRRIKAIFWE